MKKVLIIAYFYPPHTAIGAQRPYRLAKYFPESGWESIILTVKLTGKPPDGIRIIETDYKDITSIIKSRIGLNPEKGVHQQLGINVSKDFNYPTWKSKTIRLLRELISYPDDRKGWYNFALGSASELLSNEKVDAIISTSGPVISHLIARKLKKRFKVPWIADLRDLWTQNPYVNRHRIIKFFERRLELKTLFDADAIVTVTRPWIDTFRVIHRNKKIFCVTNGYDSADFPESESKQTSKFTLTYTGLLYNGKRDPSLLFKVVTQLIKENKINMDLIEIRFYGPEEDWLKDDIKKYNLEGVANLYGVISRPEVLEKQRESQILLLLLWDNKSEEGFCPGKVYEYFGAGRPIIAIGGREHVVKGLLETTGAGKYTWNYDILKGVFLEYYQEFVKSGEVKCHSNNIENYRYDSIAKRYSEILNEIVLK